MSERENNVEREILFGDLESFSPYLRRVKEHERERWQSLLDFTYRVRGVEARRLSAIRPQGEVLNDQVSHRETDAYLRGRPS